MGIFVSSIQVISPQYVPKDTDRSLVKARRFLVTVNENVRAWTPLRLSKHMDFPKHPF